MKQTTEIRSRVFVAWALVTLVFQFLVPILIALSKDFFLGLITDEVGRQIQQATGLTRADVVDWISYLTGFLISGSIAALLVWTAFWLGKEWHRLQRGLPERVPLTALCEWADQAGWVSDMQATAVGENNFWRFSKELEQAALDGKIKFRGRLYRRDIPADIKESEKRVDIDKSHFSEFDFNPTDLAQEENYNIFTCKLGKDRRLLKGKIYRDMEVNAVEARDWLENEGSPPNPASFLVDLTRNLARIHDFDPVLGLVITNLEPRDLKKCLVQIEQISFTRPDGMPMPFVLRTEGQIRGNRTGRFLLSSGQPKTIPIIFGDRDRPIDWCLFDENRVRYPIPRGKFQMVLGLYGAANNGKVMIDNVLGEDGGAYPAILGIDDDFTL